MSSSLWHKYIQNMPLLEKNTQLHILTICFKIRKKKKKIPIKSNAKSCSQLQLSYGRDLIHLLLHRKNERGGPGGVLRTLKKSFIFSLTTTKIHFLKQYQTFRGTVPSLYSCNWKRIFIQALHLFQNSAGPFCLLLLKNSLQQKEHEVQHKLNQTQANPCELLACVKNSPSLLAKFLRLSGLRKK